MTRKPELSSTSSSSFGIAYEVFLNFRGPDTCKIITDHLFSKLVSVGISVFKDEKELCAGEEISQEITEAIKQSKISIPIFSKDYAFSKSCLSELEQMWMYNEIKGQTIIPIFYDVSPSDVEHQTGDFGRAFDLHKTAGVNSNTITKWREVLQKVGKLREYSGDLYKGHEGQLVEEVVLRVARIFRDDGLVVTDKLVGIDLHIEEMMRKLGVGHSEGRATKVHGEDVRVVGIYGVPGVGKTTLAKVIFNKMRDLFDACSFLPGISSKGVQFSQDMLIADLQIEKPAPLESSGDRIEEIASLCRNAKVLIVLDNVDEDEQIKALAGKLTWFGPKSRIVVTTNNREVLSAFDVGADDCGTVEEHEFKPLGRDHALQLFCEYAFQGAAVQDVSEYFGLSMDIVKAIRWLPSDIVRHATSLRDNMNIDVWKSTLELLQKHPEDRPLPGGASPLAGDASPPVSDAPAPAGKKRSKLKSSSSSTSTSTLLSLSRIKYEVFMNFKGSDTRRTIADHLYRALRDAGISVFLDTEEIRPGQLLPQLEEAINRSRISIAIFSADFASSKYCLNHLVQMWECRKLNGQTIIPIFYNVSPSDVRNLTGKFGETFSRQEAEFDSKTINRWRKALQEISGLSGHNLEDLDGYGGQLVEEVVLSAAHILRDDGLVVTDKLVGIDPHVEEMMGKLGVAHSEGRAIEVRGEDVRVIGICGVPGVGKTTLAKIVFNKMHDLFDACSFLPGISSKGVQFSRRMLIADLQRAPRESSGDMIEEIASLCCNVKVLIVLDDVDEHEQIKALAGKLTWFGPKSRIIVTTNKREVLKALDVGADDYGTVEEHKFQPLGRDHALQLFCEHAFQGAAVEDVSEYFGLSMDIVKAIGGLPSDLVRHAKSLRDNMNMDVWKSTLELLQKHPEGRPPPGGASPLAGDASACAVDAPAPAGEKRTKPKSSSTSTLLSSSQIKYEVYLNFRGSDTRKTIVDHLDRALRDAGISVFKDSEGLLRGEIITPQLKEAINQSRISIAIFSKNFASSQWCLRELEYIWECRKLNGQIIIPIFYDVSPSDVRCLTGKFGETFSRQKARFDSETFNKWRKVLQEISGLRGYNLEDLDGHEGELVRSVVARVAQLLKGKHQVGTDKLVGIDLHVEEVMKKLGVAYSKGQAVEVQGEEVRIVGIWGMPGVGKTILAKVVFNEMREFFNASSFLEDISLEGVPFSRRLLIADLQKQKPALLESSSEGIEDIASQCRNAKVLIVLDNVDEDEQIRALAGNLSWFGPGSRIIVTTRKREVLKAFDVGTVDGHTVEEYELKQMRGDDALQLFRELAFEGKASEGVSECDSLSADIVEEIGGLPSDIVHYASILRNDLSIDTWETILKALRENPKNRQAAFRVSRAGESELEISIEDNPLTNPIQDFVKQTE